MVGLKSDRIISPELHQNAGLIRSQIGAVEGMIGDQYGPTINREFQGITPFQKMGSDNSLADSVWEVMR